MCVLLWQSDKALQHAIRIMTGNEKVRWNYYRAIKKRQMMSPTNRASNQETLLCDILQPNIRYGVLSWPKLYRKSNAKVQAKSPWQLCTVAIAFLHFCIIFFCLIVVQPEPENVNFEFFRYLCCEITAKDAYEKTSSSCCVDLKDIMHSE